MLNDKLFVVSAIKRSDIKSAIDQHLADLGHAATTDEQLTDDLCQQYADSLNSVDCEDEQDAFEQEMLDRICAKVLPDAFTTVENPKTGELDVEVS